MSQAEGFQSCGCLHPALSKTFQVERSRGCIASRFLSRRSSHPDYIQQSNMADIYNHTWHARTTATYFHFSLFNMILFSINKGRTPIWILHDFSLYAWLQSSSSSLLGNGRAHLCALFEFSLPRILIHSSNPCFSPSIPFFSWTAFAINLYFFLAIPGKLNTWGQPCPLNF